MILPQGIISKLKNPDKRLSGFFYAPAFIVAQILRLKSTLVCSVKMQAKKIPP